MIKTPLKKYLPGAFIVLVLLLPQPVAAAIMTFTDETAFNIAAGGLPDPISATENFDGFGPLPPGGIVAPCNPLSSGCGAVAPGITYTGGGSDLVIVDFSFFNFTEALAPGNLTDSLSLTVEGGGTALGLTLINDDFDVLGDDIVVDITVFDVGGVPVTTIQVTVLVFPGAGGAFFGITADGGDFIGGISIVPAGTEAPMLDGVSFNFGLAPSTTVPEPASWALVAGALGFMARASRVRAHRRQRPRKET